MGWLGLKPLCMAGLAEKLGLAIPPRFNGSLVVQRNCTATGAFEMSFFGTSNWQELAKQEQDNNARNYGGDSEVQ